MQILTVTKLTYTYQQEKTLILPLFCKRKLKYIFQILEYVYIVRLWKALFPPIIYCGYTNRVYFY